jgi:hypothetical protein
MYAFPGIFWACTALIVAVKNTGNKVTLLRKPDAVIHQMKCTERRKEEKREKGIKKARGRKSLLNYVDI